MVKKTYAFEATVPEVVGENPILAVAVRLRQGANQWRYSADEGRRSGPVVCEIVQARVCVGEQNVGLVPVPDGRQYGNTQKNGSSWVVYKVRLGRQWAHKPLRLAVHAYLPKGVEAQIEGWVVERWWEENTRPSGDGYYNDASS
jgi:hypothetical protein